MTLGGVWRRDVTQEEGPPSQVLVPEPYRAEALEQAHEHLWAGHQGAKNTQERLEQRYFWPALKRDV